MDKINFQDIQAQYLNRYQLVKVDGTEDQYDLIPVRGAVTQGGTPLRALELNQLQDNVDAALAEKLPQLPTDYTVSAGSDSNNYAEVHAYTTYTNTLRTVNGTNISARNSLIPYASEYCSLGTTTIRWNNVHARYIYQNGKRAWDSGSLPYEAEGTWTPRLYFTADNSYVAGTSGSTWGQYVRIGNMVCCTFLYTYSGTFPSGTTGTNNLAYISDLPFVAAFESYVSIPYYTNANKSGFPGIFGAISTSGTRMRLSAGNGNTFDNFFRDTLAGKSAIRFSGSFCYLI